MIFKQLHEIVHDLKIETRRIVKPNERLIQTPYGTAVYTVTEVNGVETARRLKWRVGQDYAVVAKPGLPGVTIGGVPLRVRITGIRQERLQAIDRAGAVAEGFYRADVPGERYATSIIWEKWFADPRDGYKALWGMINRKPGSRWNDDPPVWVISFERVREEEHETT